MEKAKMIKSVLSEYGISWAINRNLYNLKLLSLNMLPMIEHLYEQTNGYPKRLNIFDIDINSIQLFLREKIRDEYKERLLELADKNCHGIITGFSSLELNYGNPIDWQLNPLTGERCDERQKWYKIADFNNDRGDIKVIWEASRFAHFITLARAFLLNGDKKYYIAFSRQLDDWLKKNHYSYGANFKCGQECSLRMINCLLAYTVFKKAGVATDKDASNVKDLVDRCYRKILSNFFYAYKCIKNNHTISELVGIIVGSWCCGDYKKLNKAYNCLNEVIEEQFSADGGYKQFSFNYQRLALQALEIIFSIAQTTGKELSKGNIDRIRNSAWLMYQCQDQSGDMPNYGFNDGALVFPVTSCNYRDFRPVINTILAFTTGKQVYGYGKHQEELLWFSGGKALDKYPVELENRSSSQFIDAGLFTIRGKNSWMMIVSNDYHYRPAHMDQNHIDLWVDGVNVLCDVGTYSYASSEGKMFARNERHNTIFVNGIPQMNSRGPFMIYDWTKRELGSCADNVFEGKTISANGYMHIRTINHRDLFYEITDWADVDYEIHFHTPCEVEIRDCKAILSYEGEKVCAISNKIIDVQEVNRSLYYLKKEPIRCLIVKGQAGKISKTKILVKKGEL